MILEIEMPLIVRTLINDLGDTPTFTDSRIQQVITVASDYVIQEVNLYRQYSINIVEVEISPDPCVGPRDQLFIGLVCLKTACILDMSVFRTKAALEGIRTGLGSANLAVSGNLSGYKTILEVGPCKMYEQIKDDWNIGNATAVQAILSPFVGNTFDPKYFNRSQIGGYQLGDGIYS